MAKFKTTLCDGESNDISNCQGKLLLAVLLWLRTYDRDGPQWLGLQSLVELLVPHSTEMKLGLEVPKLQVGFIVSSAGDIWRVEGEGKFLYSSSNFKRELDLDLYGGLELSYRVHTRWIEWALHTALLELSYAGKPWHRDQHGQFKQKTIGGFDVAGFL